MYPLLISCLVSATKDQNYPDFVYPAEVLREGFRHIPLLSYCRRQAELAIRASGGLADIDPKDTPMLRWRASVGERANGIMDAYKSRLELFLSNPDESLRLVYSAPLCGPEFEALPLVLRLGLELLIRKECRGGDTE
jgi:hypothetical protein